jgi:hypothetical protein
MAEAEEIATRLAYKFLRAGQYSASSGPVELPGAMAAAAADGQGDGEFSQLAGEFSGLAVQSVGFETGSEVDNPKVHIYLTRSSVKQIKDLPQEIDGVSIRAHKMGSITVRPDAAAAATNRGNIYERNNRICCGSSCGPTSENCSGTIGALVRIGQAPQLYLLSNNHVLAGCNHVPHNQPILAPSSMDGRADARAPQEVARHHTILELRSGDPNFVIPCDADVALARVSDAHQVSSWQGDANTGYDTPAIAREPDSLMRVKKTGRTTGLTRGEVEAKINTPVAINYTSKRFKGVVWFKDVWTVRALPGHPFALLGDSGSLVVTEDAVSAVGLVFAANQSGDYAWIVPMPCAVNSLGGLQMQSGHGV